MIQAQEFMSYSDQLLKKKVISILDFKLFILTLIVNANLISFVLIYAYNFQSLFLYILLNVKNK